MMIGVVMDLLLLVVALERKEKERATTTNSYSLGDNPQWRKDINFEGNKKLFLVVW